MFRCGNDRPGPPVTCRGVEYIQDKWDRCHSGWDPCRLPVWPGSRPGTCHGENTARLRIFDDACCGDLRGVVPAAPPITVTNPCDCREKAVVRLGIDDCGNLVVLVRRDCR